MTNLDIKVKSSSLTLTLSEGLIKSLASKEINSALPVSAEDSDFVFPNDISLVDMSIHYDEDDNPYVKADIRGDLERRVSKSPTDYRFYSNSEGVPNA